MSFESAIVTADPIVPADASLQQELQSLLGADIELNRRQSVASLGQTLEGAVSRVVGYVALGISLYGAIALLQRLFL